MESLTFRFHDQFATHFWRKALLRSTAGVPNSGWITFHVRGEDDFTHALWLMRLSYLRYMLKTTNDPRWYLDDQSKELQLTPQLKSLFEVIVRSPCSKISSGVAAMATRQR